MQLGSVRALKQELDEQLRRRNALKEKVSYAVSGLGDAYVQEMFRPPLAKGVVRIGPRDYGLAIRVYEGKDGVAKSILKSFTRYGQEVQVVRGVRYRPRALVVENVLPVGASIGHYRVTAGTLGGFVRDNDGVYILSNNHVLANSNKADGLDPILMPGPADIEASYEVVAFLDRWMPLQRRAPDSLDAAVARLRPGARYHRGYVDGVGRVAREPIDNRFSVHGVFKLGRTTRLTRGVVTAFELDDVMVNYGTASRPQWLQFDNQLEFASPHPGATFSKPGDSGSVIYDEATRKPYALLFAGGPDAQGRDRTLGHFLPPVLEALNVEMA